MLESAEHLVCRFQTTMTSSDADDAIVGVAQLLREAAERLLEANPDRDVDFSAGVDWAVNELRIMAVEIEDI